MSANKLTSDELKQKLLIQKEKINLAKEMKEYGKNHANDSLNELKEWELTEAKWE